MPCCFYHALVTFYPSDIHHRLLHTAYCFINIYFPLFIAVVLSITHHTWMGL